MRLTFIVPLALCLTAPAVLAESVAMNMVFGRDSPCFGRVYDADHLAAHPDQQVASFVLFADSEDMELDRTDQWLMVVEVTTRASKTPYSGIGICADGNEGLYCLMEGDAGGFFVSDIDGRLQVEVLDRG